jgi:putative tricarboxylic transport membrane protein
VRVNDAVLGLFLIAFAVAVALVTRGFPDMPGQRFGPRDFPNLIALGFAVAGAVLVRRGWRARGLVPWVRLGAWMTSRRHLADVAAVIGAVLFYVFASPTLGFAPTAFLLLAALMLRLGGRPVPALAAAAAGAAVIHLAFAVWLRVPLPLGLMRHVLY